MKKTHLAICLLALIWGSTWLAIKVGLGSMPPFYFASMRFVIASLALLPLALSGKRKRLTMSFPMVLFSGLLLIPVPYGLTYWGAQHISSGLTAVLFSTMPIFVALFSTVLLPDESLSISGGAGLVLGFSGILFIYSDDIMVADFLSSLGVGTVLLGSITSAFGVVLIKRKSSEYDPVLLCALHFIIGAVFLLPLGLLFEEWTEVRFNFDSVFSLFYLAMIGSSLAFVLYYWLITKMEVTKVSLLIYATPVIATFLGWAVLGEALTVQMAVGTTCVLGGIKLAS